MSRESPDFSPRGEAELLVAFVNTHDLEEGSDAIAEPAELAGWIAATGALDQGAPRPESGAPDRSGLRRVLALREALRSMFLANNGATIDRARLAPVEDAAGRARLRLSADERGVLRLTPAGGGADALEARLLLAVERVQAAGEWPRLKACLGDTCQWAFFDASRNRSRTWCSMEVCGNRSKTRRYRRRRVSATRPSG